MGQSRLPLLKKKLKICLYLCIVINKLWQCRSSNLNVVTIVGSIREIKKNIIKYNIYFNMF